MARLVWSRPDASADASSLMRTLDFPDLTSAPGPPRDPEACRGRINVLLFFTTEPLAGMATYPDNRDVLDCGQLRRV